MEKLSVSAILMDVDGTMTDVPTSGKSMSRGPLELLTQLVSESRGLTLAESKALILSCGDTATTCLSEFLPSLGVSLEHYFDVVRDELARHILVPRDTLEFFQAMKERGVPISTATTNSPFMTRAKLAVAGLADSGTCEYLVRYHAGNEFGDPKGKFSEHFFPNILKNHNYDPSTLMMIGDEPERDLYPALQAGIRYGVIICRNQSEPIILKDGGIFVRSFKDLADHIQPVNGVKN